MSEAKKILELIESVRPDDVETLDEIDARVWCYLNSYLFLSFEMVTVGDRGENKELSFDFETQRGDEESYLKRYIKSPTRSRDALKAIRPDGVVPVVSYYPEGFEGYCVGSKGHSPRLPTEELAELHAVIQAIEWERSRG